MRAVARIGLQTAPNRRCRTLLFGIAILPHQSAMSMTTEADQFAAGTPRELALLDQAHTALAEARTVDEVRNVRDRAEAVRAYARKARLGRSIVVEAAAVRLRAERRLGQLLQTLPLAKAAPGNQYSPSESPDVVDQVRLQDIGLTKSDSSRLQRIAMIPEDSFQSYVTTSVEENRECTSAGCLRLGKSSSKTAAAKRGTVRESASPLLKLIRAGQRFGTIYAAPFHAMTETIEGHEHRAPTNLKSLCDEPVGQLCEPNAHLHLQTSGDFLRNALDLMDAWGFRYASCTIGSSHQSSGSVRWQPCPDLLLFGFRDPQGTDTPVPEFPASEELLASVHDLIQRISPGPYLDLTSNAIPVNDAWTTFMEVP